MAEGSHRSITVVIPARDAAATLSEQLAALRLQADTETFSVVVVDNGSVDATAAIAEAFDAPGFTVSVISEPRAGVNTARNAGIAAAAAVAADGIVLLCDADDQVRSGWVTALAAAVDDTHWGGGWVDYRPLNTHRTRELWGAPEMAGPIVQHAEQQTFGGNCGFTTQMWQRLGGFDEMLSGAGDENEFFRRAWMAGYRLRPAPDAIIAYRLRPGLRAMLRQRYRSGWSQAAAATRDGGDGLLPLVRWRAIGATGGKLLVTAPTYAFSRSRRLLWSAAVARCAGRTVGRWSHRKELAARSAGSATTTEGERRG